jgi:precorrin-6B methylase 2
MAILSPGAEVVAVECDPQRAAFVRINRQRFGTYNMRILEGTAPAVLAAEQEQPRLVFIGGSGPHLSALLDFVAERLRPGGRLLGNFVVLEHLTLMLQWVRGRGWTFELTELGVARSDRLAGLTGLKPQRGVFLVRADKPEAPRE